MWIQIHSVSKILDVAVLGLLGAFFVGVLAFDVAYFGFHEAIIPIPHLTEPYFEVLPWAILALLIADIYLKYKKVGSDWKALFRNHWFDIVVALLIPIFMPLKFIKLVKIMKTAKSGVKIIQKAKKLFKLH